ncbi:hypothetical protein BaRGS_00031778 [Batillaria attramentaria]|uniref:SRCR domain-containing protein n=1 Tax=Batillaria attramentaria TaxID=370345 RepID=A0ABD0JR48_9CAEN
MGLEKELSAAQATLDVALTKVSKLEETRKWKEDTVSRKHLRLVNGSNDYEGRLEVKSGDQWRSVCENSWSKNSAQLICSMLGYPGPNVAAVGARVFGNGAGYTLSPPSYCSRSAGVICGDLDSYPVRLVNGSYPHEGRLEIRIAGQWGTVCHNGWDSADAKVACNMLGFEGQVLNGATATGGAMFGRGTGPEWMNGVDCVGDENHLLSCPASYPAGHSSQCSHNYDAGVICGDWHHYPLRLVGGTNEREGRVEVKINGLWTSIYDTYWDTREAEVVCRALGYNW